MNPLIIIGIVIGVLLVIMVALYIFGNKLQKKQMAQKEEINAAAQQTSMFIIDKKIMPIKDAKLPKIVMDQMPKKYQKSKVPVVKAKVGPQLVTLICDEAIFADVPQHGEVKAMVSGIYLVGVKTLHKNTKKKMQEAEEAGKKKKKSFREKMIARQAQYQKELAAETERRKLKAAEKENKAKAKKNREIEKKLMK